MKFTNIVLAASAAGMAVAYPSGRDVIPDKRSIEKKRATGFTWFGVSESGAEFGSAIPGTLGKDYTWPLTSKIQVLRTAGMNIFRVPFLMERLVPGSITGTLDSTYLAALKSTVNYITESGAYAVLDPHNYGRYSGNVITSTDDFKTWWKTVATEFASNPKVIFDTNNEYHDIDQTLVLNLNQAAIDGIRAAGATSQYIFVEGNAWTGAWSWTNNNDNMKDLTDPQDKIVYEMHQYLDSDSSGTSETCVSGTIGQERLQSATAWLKSNGKKGFIGEFAGGANSVCESAVEGMLSYMSDNTDVWMGAEWWAAGPWWGSYMYSMEPNDGPAYSTYLPILEKYFVSGSSSSSSSSSTTTTTAKATTTTKATTTAAAQQTTTSTTAAVVVTTTPPNQVEVSNSETHTSSTTSASHTTTSSATHTNAVPVAPTTTLATKTSSTQSCSSTTSAPSTGGTVPHWYQCGGLNWTGATACESGFTCVKQNPYYSQCL
ncbi:putative endo-beta-1,4-glucanase B [Penicillium rolfsii]|nr:putative endo-beta-1,4-glucanase B [Penicillium rolfsii]